MAKNKSFELNTREPKVKKPKAEKPPKEPKQKKPKAFKEKAVKISKEKPIKEKQPKAFKEKQPKAFKVQKEKAVKQPKVKKEKAPKGESQRKFKLSAKATVIISIVLVVVVSATIAGILIGKNIKAENNKVSKITISSTPYDTEYIVGESELNCDGLRIIATKNNGEQYNVSLSDCIISGFDSSKAVKSQTIRVNYQGFIATFTIKIVDVEIPPVLVGVSVSVMPKLTYTYVEGEELVLDTAGGRLLREYSDGSTQEIGLVNSYVINFNKNWGEGEYTLTIRYKENGVTLYCYYDIVVDDPTNNEE